MRKKQTSPKKNLAPSSARGQGYQSMSNSATTRLLFQIKTTYGRQTTSEQKRNPKRLADLTDRNSLLIPSRVSSKAGFNSPLLYCKNRLLFFLLSHALFFFNTLAVGAWHLQSAFKEKNVSRKRDPPSTLSLSLSLSLAHWQGGTSQAHYSQRIYGAEPNGGEKASVNNCREQRTHISRSFEISLGMQLSGIKIKNITQLRQNPTKKH